LAAILCAIAIPFKAWEQSRLDMFDTTDPEESSHPGRFNAARRAATAPESLSRVERQVFDLLRDNICEQAIASRLCYTPAMTHRHIRSIYRKCLACS